MSQEASGLSPNKLTLELDLETGELAGVVTILTPLGTVSFPTDPELVKALLEEILNGHPNQSPSNFPPASQELEELEEQLGEMPPEMAQTQFTPLEEEAEAPMRFGAQAAPPTQKIRPQEEVDELEEQVRKSLIQATRGTGTRRQGVELIDDGGNFEEAGPGETKIP